MTQHEQGSAEEKRDESETIGQQFNKFVTAHTTTSTKVGGEIVGEDLWKIDIPIPIIGDSVAGIAFTERRLYGDDFSITDDRGYDITVMTQKGICVTFTSEPTNPNGPYYYWAQDESGIGPIDEMQIAKFLAELQGHEAAGLLTRVDMDTTGGGE